MEEALRRCRSSRNAMAREQVELMVPIDLRDSRLRAESIHVPSPLGRYWREIPDYRQSKGFRQGKTWLSLTDWLTRT